MPTTRMLGLFLLVLVVGIQARKTNDSGLAFSGRPFTKRCDELCRSHLEVEKCQCSGRRPVGNPCLSKICRKGSLCKLFKGGRPACIPIPIRCLQAPRHGLCVGHHVRYHFSAVERVCKRFIFGGCGRVLNDNNFHNVDTCYRTCMFMRG